MTKTIMTNPIPAYTITLATGETHTAPTYEAAIDLAEALGAEITEHSGDLSDGGSCTLVWASEEDAADDAGGRAMATITHLWRGGTRVRSAAGVVGRVLRHDDEGVVIRWDTTA